MIDEGIDFASARMESTIKKNYMLKQLKNKSAKSFLVIYLNSNGEVTKNLKKVACLYKRSHSGISDTNISDEDLEEITDEEINEIYGKIKDGASQNFTKFYESYRRKIDKGYFDQNIVNNAYNDLKTAYSTYRMVNNPLWNLKKEQITEAEMANLYNKLVPQTGENPTNPISKDKEEK